MTLEEIKKFLNEKINDKSLLTTLKHEEPGTARDIEIEARKLAVEDLEELLRKLTPKEEVGNKQPSRDYM